MSDLSATNRYLSDILRAVQGGDAHLLEQLLQEVRWLREALTRPAPPTAEELRAFRTAACAESHSSAESMDLAADLLASAAELLAPAAGEDHSVATALSRCVSALRRAQAAAERFRERAAMAFGDRGEVEHG